MAFSIIAQTIWDQLGQNKFAAMTGAKDFVAGACSLTFRIGRNASKANKVRITLAGNDTYTVEFFRVRGIECDKLATFNCVYADKLREIFTRSTGLYTSL